MTDRILVTGASGFVGSAVARRLRARGHEVVALLRRDSDATALDALEVAVERFDSLDQVREIAARVAPVRSFHLATHYLRSHRPADIAPLLAANVEFGVNLLDGLVASGGPVVVASSFFQYRGGAAMPISLYAATKQAFSEIAAYYRRVEGLPVREVVLYETYGSNDPRDKLIPQLLAAADSGSELTLGSPEQLLELVHVNDAATGLIQAAEGDGETTALRSLSPSSIRDLVAAVEAATGRSLAVTYRPGAVPNPLVLEAGDWAPPHGWSPSVNLEDGLRTAAIAARDPESARQKPAG